MATRVPYSQQFTPEQTPLIKLLPILRQNAGKRDKLRTAIAAAFFKGKADPAKLAGNTLISLSTYGIIAGDGNLTPFGQQLIAVQADIPQAHALLAKRLLVDMEAVVIVETLREVSAAGIKPSLESLPDELGQRGIDASRNSSDLSGVFNWLREAGVLTKYEVNDARLVELLGTPTGTLQAFKNLTNDQIAFARAMVALNVTDWTPCNTICKYAEALYSGEIRYYWKDIIQAILKPLQDVGLVEIRKKAKQDQETPEGRGGKAIDVKPTGKFEKEVAEPLLTALHKSAGYEEIHAIRGKALEDIVKDVDSSDTNTSGKALEFLAIRLCQMLDLEFMGWRKTDEDLAGGSEVGTLLHSARLIFSRWQVQCKVGGVTLEAVSKEVGMKDVTLADVVLLVGTNKATERAQTFRQKIVGTSSLNIIFFDGPLLQAIIDDPPQLVEALRRQAEHALRNREAPRAISQLPYFPRVGFGTPHSRRQRLP